MKKRSIIPIALSLAGVLLVQGIHAEQKAVLEGHRSAVMFVVFSPDGQTLASGSWDHTVRLWNVESGEQKAVLEGHTDLVLSVVFSPDGQTLAGASYDHTVRLWNVESGEQKAVLEGHTDGLYSVDFSPDGQTLASGGWDQTVRLWNVESGEQKAVLEGHTAEIYSVVFSPDGQTLASASGHPTVRLWNVESGEPKALLKGHWSGPEVAFSPDGQTLASAYHRVRLWNVESGEQKAVLEGHTDLVRSIAFSPDGQTLASGSWDRTVRLWNVESGEQKAVLEDHTGGIWYVAFSPDGQTLASASTDGTIRLWNVESGEQKAVLEDHTDWVRSIAFSPDGQTLASGSDDHTVRLWNVAGYTDILPDARPPMQETAEETTLVEALVLGGEVDGLLVEFSRAVSGRPRDYVWAATTDADGRVELIITNSGRGRLNGYYEARARSAAGDVVGKWNSIPLNRNRRQRLELTLGGGVRVVAIEPLGSAKAAAGLPQSGLQPNAPNPFNSSTQIVYRLTAAGPVQVEIYNLLGQHVRTLVDKVQAVGTYHVIWDARDGQGAAVSAGVYVTRLRHADGVQTRRLLYLK